MASPNNYRILFCQKKIKDFLKVIFSKNVAVAVSLGQVLSLLICGTAITSGLLQSVSIPTGQSFLNYFLLSIVFTTILVCRIIRSNCSLQDVLRDRAWKYFLLGFVEVEANYLVVKAYQYTSVTSVQLLDCIAIPTVLVLSRCLLRVSYRWQHIVGVIVCLLGAVALVVADHLSQRFDDVNQNNNNQLLGDILCIGGSILYGISNVGQEIMVSKHGSIDYLGSIGFFACFINGCQFAILERGEFLKVDFSSFHIFLPFIGYAICLFSFYCLMPYTISRTSAMAVNLNLLSSDFFSLVIGLFVFHYTFHFLYFASFGMIMFGVLLYNIRPPFQKSIIHETSNNGNIPDEKDLASSEEVLLSEKTGNHYSSSASLNILSSHSGITNASQTSSYRSCRLDCSPQKNKYLCESEQSCSRTSTNLCDYDVSQPQTSSNLCDYDVSPPQTSSNLCDYDVSQIRTSSNLCDYDVSQIQTSSDLYKDDPPQTATLNLFDFHESNLVESIEKQITVTHL